MREIKFRLYNKHDKKMYIFEPQWGNFGQGGGWVGGVLLEDYEREGRTFAPSNQMQLEPESCEWMEFTGLLDKQGKEIYEGDIVKQEYSGGSLEADISIIRFGFYDHTDGDIRDSGYGWFTETVAGYGKGEISGIGNPEYTSFIEVIGNIYESPQLLEDK